MEFQWNLNGISMGFQWDFNGFQWDLNGVHTLEPKNMACLWVYVPVSSNKLESYMNKDVNMF